MKLKKQTGLPAAADVACRKLLSRFRFRLFQRGAAEESPIVILTATGTPPADPLACSQLIPLETCASVYRAVERAPEAAHVPHGIAFVCSVVTVASDLIAWLCMAGAVMAGAGV